MSKQLRSPVVPSSDFVRCVVIYDGKFKLKNNQPASFNMHYEGYLKRYLDVFDHVTLMSRLYRVEDIAASSVVGKNTNFLELPMFTGEVNYIWNIPKLLRLFWHELDAEQDVVILRLPSLVGIWAYAVCWIKGIPVMLEIAGDPADDFSQGVAKRQGMRKKALYWLHKGAYVWPMKFLCRRVFVISYVTKYVLQRKYPANQKAFVGHYTTLNLYSEDFVKSPKRYDDFKKQEYHLVHVGMMQRLIKGQDILITALSILKNRGLQIKLTLVGDGDERCLIEQFAVEAGVQDDITFTGLKSSGADVRDILDKSDIFVLPSRQEGLPRALIEAMARGLPCIASDVGGVSELLEKDMMIPRNNALALADIIEQLVNNPERLVEASERNLREVEAYLYDKVQVARIECYQELRKLR